MKLYNSTKKPLQENLSRLQDGAIRTSKGKQQWNVNQVLMNNTLYKLDVTQQQHLKFKRIYRKEKKTLDN